MQWAFVSNTKIAALRECGFSGLDWDTRHEGIHTARESMATQKFTPRRVKIAVIRQRRLEIGVET